MQTITDELAAALREMIPEIAFEMYKSQSYREPAIKYWAEEPKPIVDHWKDLAFVSVEFIANHEAIARYEAKKQHKGDLWQITMDK